MRAPDEAFKKGSDVGTPPPSTRDSGFSPEARQKVGEETDLDEASKEGTAATGAVIVVATTVSQGFPQVPNPTNNPHGREHEPAD